MSEVSARKVDRVFTITGAYISTDAIKFAMKKNIDMIFSDESGGPYGRVCLPCVGSLRSVEDPKVHCRPQPSALTA